jgi:hypothetical protein
MGFNLTGTQVKDTYQRLAQISGSYLNDGTGSVITNLTVTSSYASVANSVAYTNITGKPTLVSGSAQIVIGSTTGNLSGSRVIGAVAGTVAYANITGKPALVSGSAQITTVNTIGTFPASRLTGDITASAVPWTGITGKPVGLVSGSSQISFTGITGKPTLVSGSAQIAALGFATTGSNTFIGNQAIQGNVTFVSSSFISSNNQSGSIYISALNAGTVYLNSDGGEGNVNVGYNGWGGKLNVEGNVTIEETLTVTNIEGTGSLILQPNNADSRAFEIYNTSPADIHIKSNSDYAFFGDDTNYLKIDNPAGQVTIDASNRIFLDTDSTVIGDLNVSGTFYPNQVSFFSSSIAQTTGSYVLTTSALGVVQYDTYANIAKAVQGNIQIQSTAGNLSGSRIVGAVANATAAVSASYALTATTATSSTNAEDVRVYVKNTSGAIIAKGIVVRISGASGDNPEIALAQPSTDALSANAIGITSEQIAINGFGYAVTSGRIVGLNTNAFPAGTNLYLGTSGSLQSTPQTAPNHTVRLGQVLRQQINNGSIYVKVDNGYEISELHDVVISYPSASGDLLQFDGTVWRNTQNLSGTYNFGGTQTFNNINVNGTGSFAYILQVTGSIVKTGENFIQLNTDTPVQRFGGIKVVDSGSLQTGSIMWDSLENHWIYENTAEGTYKAGGFLAGPKSTDIYNVLYPTLNKVLKSQGEDHVTDSSITDTGVKVDFSTNVIVTGSVNASAGFIGNASSATSASYVTGQEDYARKSQSNIFTQRQTLKAGANITGSLTFNVTEYEGIDLMQGDYTIPTYSTPIRFYSGSKKNDYANNKWVNMQVTPGTLPWVAVSSFPENSHFMYFQPAYTSGTGRNRVSFESQISGYDAGLQINDAVYITGSLRVSTTLDVLGKTTFSDQVVGAVTTITPASNTGSLDCSLGNFFTMTLGSGVDTLLNPSNIHAGQTINVGITQNGTTAGTISFPSSVKFAGGTDYVASTGLGAKDVLTLVSFDGSTLLATAVKNLS